MNDDQQKKQDKFMRIQQSILWFLAATYHAQQEKASIEVAEDFNPVYIELLNGAVVLNRNDRRGKATIYNDGPSDCWIGNQHLDVQTLTAQLNGGPGQVIAATILRVNDKIEIEAKGAIHAAPTTSTQTCVLRAHETLFSTWPNQSPVLGDKGFSGGLWNGSFKDGIPDMPDVTHSPLV